jgi:hypothetical protein
LILLPGYGSRFKDKDMTSGSLDSIAPPDYAIIDNQGMNGAGLPRIPGTEEKLEKT